MFFHLVGIRAFFVNKQSIKFPNGSKRTDFLVKKETRHIYAPHFLLEIFLSFEFYFLECPQGKNTADYLIEVFFYFFERKKRFYFILKWKNKNNQKVIKNFNSTKRRTVMLLFPHLNLL